MKGKGRLGSVIEFYKNNNRETPLIIDSAYERGLTYDAAFQIGSLLKSNSVNKPLNGYSVKSIIPFGINDYNTFSLHYTHFFVWKWSSGI